MSDAPTQEELLDKFVEKLAAEDGKLVQKILDHVHVKVEDSLSGLKNKNAELRKEKDAEKAKSDELAKLLRSKERTSDDPVILSRTDALDPRKYRKAKKEAADLGVELRIAGRDDN